MDYTTFGRTGLRVSVMGLGCGGPSRIGQTTGQSEADSIDVVRRALEAGVNYIDTAEAYKTEALVGEALQDFDRSQLVISTKKSYRKGISPASVREGVETSLRNLQTDYIDIYNIHGVAAKDYPMLRAEILPTFFELRDEGKIRFIGCSEMFGEDTTHEMLRLSLPDDVWDVVMVGFNILNQTARQHVFPQTMAQNVAVQIMFAVRRALSRPQRLVEVLQELVDLDEIHAADVDMANPLGFVLDESDAPTLTDAAYRFVRYEPGVDVVLSGTGNPAHLDANIKSLNRPPLPAAVVDKLRTIFRYASSVTGG